MMYAILLTYSEPLLRHLIYLNSNCNYPAHNRLMNYSELFFHYSRTSHAQQAKVINGQ